MSSVCFTQGVVLARSAQVVNAKTSSSIQHAFVNKSVALSKSAQLFNNTKASGLSKSNFSSGFKIEKSLSFVVQALAEADGEVEASPEASKCFCGNISWDTQSEDLRELFSQYGEVQEANVIVDGATGRSRGFAFITMSSPAEATAAIEGLNGAECDGRSLRVDKVLGPNDARPERVERAPRARQQDSPFRLYVGNLPWRFDDYDLEDAFQEFGEMQEARIIFDRDTGRSRGFGFVTLSSDEDVEAAIAALDGAEIDGRAIRVNRAQQRE